MVTTAAADGWDQQALRREQLADNDLGPLMREMEAGRRPEWKDISDRGPIYKSYWAQWKSLALRNGVLVCHWESADGKKKKTAQVVIPNSRVKEVLTKIHGGTSGGHLGFNKTIDKFCQRYYWLNLRGDVERWRQQYDTCATSRGPRTRSRGLMHQYNIGAPFERNAIDIAGHFLESDQGNISPGHHGLLHEVARSIRHPKPRGIDSGRRPGDPLLRLRCTNRVAQRPGSQLRIQVDAGGPGATGCQQN